MAELKMREMCSCSVSEIVETLSNNYASIINSGMPLSMFPSTFLWGQPGVGKSQGVREIAKRLEKLTKKKVVVTDVRLLLFNPVDLRGIPFANAEHTATVWLKPKILDMSPAKNVVNILFLDELSAAPQSVQAAAYQLVLDRRVGEHELPENTIVIAAGNRVSDKSVAYKMPKALANRFLHFEVSTDFSSWQKWATGKIHPLVIAFLCHMPQYLNTFDTSKENLCFATPRSWEMVSNILDVNGGKAKSCRPLITGLVGAGVANEFIQYEKTMYKLPTPEEVFRGKVKCAPTDLSLCYALISSLVRYAKVHQDDTEGLINCISFAATFRREFMTLLLEEFFIVDESLSKTIQALPEFQRLLRNNPSLNGIMHGYLDA